MAVCGAAGAEHIRLFRGRTTDGYHLLAAQDMAPLFPLRQRPERWSKYPNDSCQNLDKPAAAYYNTPWKIPYASSAPAGVRPAGEDREPGENPGRYRRCMRRGPYSSAKAGHWETGKAE